VQYLPYWQQDSPDPKKAALQAEIVLKPFAVEELSEVKISMNDVSELKKKPVQFLKHLFFKTMKNRRLRKKTLPFLRPSFQFLDKIHLNPILAGLVIITLMLAGWILMDVHRLALTKSELSRELSKLEQNLTNLKSISAIETEYFKRSALLSALERVRIDPVFILNEIEKKLPPSVWIQSFAFEYGSIRLVLLDSDSVDISLILDALELRFNKVILENTDVIELNGQHIKTVTISFQHNSQTDT